jgi:hypothetical protein
MIRIMALLTVNTLIPYARLNTDLSGGVPGLTDAIQKPNVATM